MSRKETIPNSPLPADNRVQRVGNGLLVNSQRWHEYMTTEEAAAYLRKSVSWLVRQPDIPYVRGVPNTYKREDLDDWFERHKFVPQVA